jgi:ornithine carbamoyltransferase
MTRNFLSILDLSPDELHRAIELARRVKTDRALGARAPTAGVLDGRCVGLLFEKPSLRTRVTFTIGVRELGGEVVEIPADVMHADREPIHDVARNLERWVDAVVIRTFGQRPWLTSRHWPSAGDRSTIAASRSSATATTSAHPSSTPR